MGRVSGTAVFVIGEFLVFAAFAFHAFNGVRLALIELGFAIGKPIEPIYPYRTSVHEQRPLAMAVMLLAGIVLAAGGYNFLVPPVALRSSMRDQRLWTWHVLAGLVIFVLLGLHMAIMHLDTLLGWFNPAGMKPIAWDSVVQRARMGFFAVTYIVLLGAALFHGLYGLRNILFELGLGAGAKKGLQPGSWPSAAWPCSCTARGRPGPPARWRRTL